MIRPRAQVCVPTHAVSCSMRAPPPSQMDSNRPPPAKLPDYEEWRAPPGGPGALGADLFSPPPLTAPDVALQRVEALKARVEAQSAEAAAAGAEAEGEAVEAAPPPSDGGDGAGQGGAAAAEEEELTVC
eukprot:1344459-Prymnesium_polylepis.1